MAYAILLFVLGMVLGSCSLQPKIYPGSQNQNSAFSNIRSENIGEETTNYRSYNLNIQLRERNGGGVPIKYLESKLPGKKKFVIILPIYGSSEYPPTVTASRLTFWNESADFNVALVKERGDLFDWEALGNASSKQELSLLLEDGVKRIKQAIVEIQSVLDWAYEESGIDANRVGIAGFSLGSMVATIAMGIDTRIKAGAFVMVGGDPHEIFANSEADFIKNVRLNALKRFSKSSGEFKDVVRKALDPININYFANVIPPENVIIFQAKLDTFIPQSSRDNFWRSFRRQDMEPLRVVFPRDHKMAFLSMTPLGGNYTDIKIAEFLRQRL